MRQWIDALPGLGQHLGHPQPAPLAARDGQVCSVCGKMQEAVA
jgi:hypothetical protein